LINIAKKSKQQKSVRCEWAGRWASERVERELAFSRAGRALATHCELAHRSLLFLPKKVGAIRCLSGWWM